MTEQQARSDTTVAQLLDEDRADPATPDDYTVPYVAVEAPSDGG